MSSDRFNKAARDGYLDALKEATRKDLNQKDEDGMTPTLWASFEGNLDALRLIVGRGGDPDKCDNYGNTALHFASARGHLHCVTFLVNFGVNMWALDIDFHTPKDLAAINNKEEILRFLDAAIAKAETSEAKKVKSYKEKAAKEAEKRVKKFDELQKKASKSAQEQQRKLQKNREKMEKNGGLMGPNIVPVPGGPPIDPMTQSMSSQQKQSHYPGLPFITSLRKDTKALQNNSGSHSFSELTSSTQSSRASKTTGSHTGVYKKILQQKSAKAVGSDFKVGDITDGGKRSVRSLSGLRRDNEVMYVPKYEITSANNIGKRGKISGLFEENENGRRPSRTGSEPEDNDEDEENPNRLTRSSSQPDYIHRAGVHSIREEPITNLRDHTGGVSMFERPGFGSVAFRKNMSSTLNNFASFTSTSSNSHYQPQNGSHRLMEELLEEEDNGFHRDSIGSASSLNGRNAHPPQRIWDDGDAGSADELEELDGFLAAANLIDYAHVFAREKIDLEALLLLTDADFKQMGIELGPRRKLINAIEERHRVMENPGEVIDSRL